MSNLFADYDHDHDTTQSPSPLVAGCGLLKAIQMDSLDMNNLATSLPSSTIVKAEQDTMDKFKAAAQSLTLLYRSSQKAAKRHFDAGYATALGDLMSVIQHGVSAAPDTVDVGRDEGMSIGRIMDWIEARQESIRVKARDDDEDEEEKDSRNRGSVATKPTVRTSGAGDVRDKAKARSPTGHTASSPPLPGRRSLDTASTDLALEANDMPSPAPTSAPTRSLSSPASSPMIQCSVPPLSSARPQARARLRSHYAHGPLSATSANTNHSANSSLSTTSSVTSLLGAKRRHAAMLLDAYSPASAPVSLPSTDFGATSSPTSLINNATPRYSDGFMTSNAAPTAPSGQRRRVRNPRGVVAPRSENVAFNDAHGLAIGDAMMDVEEDNGRERKRISRR